MIHILCTTRNKYCNASIELQSSRWDSDLRKKEKKIRSKNDYTFLTTKTTMMTTILMMQLRSSFFIQCLHRSGHKQINFETETKWISSKPKQNGAETKPITYNNKQNYRLPTTTNKTIDCLRQKTKLPIAYIDNKQNSWLLAITATNKTSIDYLQGSIRLKKTTESLLQHQQQDGLLVRTKDDSSLKNSPKKKKKK